MERNALASKLGWEHFGRVRIPVGVHGSGGAHSPRANGIGVKGQDNRLAHDRGHGCRWPGGRERKCAQAEAPDVENKGAVIHGHAAH